MYIRTSLFEKISSMKRFRFLKASLFREVDISKMITTKRHFSRMPTARLSNSAGCKFEHVCEGVVPCAVRSSCGQTIRHYQKHDLRHSIGEQ